MKLNKLRNKMGSSFVKHRSSGEFFGFKWENVFKVHNLFKDRFLKLKQSKSFSRDDDGDMIITKEQWNDVLESVRNGINKRSQKAIDYYGHDNGWAANCLKLVGYIETEVTYEE